MAAACSLPRACMTTHEHVTRPRDGYPVACVEPFVLGTAVGPHDGRADNEE